MAAGFHTFSSPRGTEDEAWDAWDAWERKCSNFGSQSEDLRRKTNNELRLKSVAFPKQSLVTKFPSISLWIFWEIVGNIHSTVLESSFLQGIECSTCLSDPSIVLAWAWGNAATMTFCWWSCLPMLCCNQKAAQNHKCITYHSKLLQADSQGRIYVQIRDLCERRVLNWRYWRVTQNHPKCISCGKADWKLTRHQGICCHIRTWQIPPCVFGRNKNPAYYFAQSAGGREAK